MTTPSQRIRIHRDPYQERMTNLFRVSERRRHKYKQLVMKAEEDASSSACLAFPAFPCPIGPCDESSAGERGCAALPSVSIHRAHVDAASKTLPSKPHSSLHAARNHDRRHHLGRAFANERLEVKWDDTWFHDVPAGGDSGDGTDLSTNAVAAPAPSALASGAGSVEKRMYDPENEKKINDDGETYEHGSKESASRLLQSWLLSGNATSVPSWDDTIGAIINQGSWVDVEPVTATETAPVSAGRCYEKNAAGFDNVSKDVTTSVLGVCHPIEHTDQQIEVCYDGDPKALGTEHQSEKIEGAPEPFGVLSESTWIAPSEPQESGSPSEESPASSHLDGAPVLLLVRQVDRVTGDVVEIQVDNPEVETGPPVVWSSADSSDSVAGMIYLQTGTWVEIQEPDEDSAGECSDGDTSTRTVSSCPSSSSLASSAAEVTEYDDSWSTLDDVDDESLEEEMGSLQDISGDTNDVVKAIMAKSAGGGCGIGGGLCTDSEIIDKDTHDASREIDDQGELPAREDRVLEVRSIKQDRGVTVAEYFFCVSQEMDPPLHRQALYDDSSLVDDQYSAGNETLEDDDRDDEDQGGHGGDAVLNQVNGDVVSQYLCCGQEHALLMRDSYDLDDELGDSVAA